jgi:hypothetical protein
VKERANALFPFAIAIALPPAGAILGVAAYLNDQDRDLAIRLVVTAVLGACLWGILLASL